MKLPTLATASSLVLLTLVKSALGCGAYRACNCYNDDGAANDNATQTVCSRFDSGTTNFTEGVCQYTGPDSITRVIYMYYYAMDNCDWREMCTEAGATGADSSCDNKVQEANIEYAHHN
ncbi:uncharacterized protein LY79DRAFT_563589 [Colletotrichum navitas]|uniref:Uncharacterized protein n=1 Tax=Colletotrichum navitas TaxID=681940 RepID=A0AAD8V1F0_9PEZI|nr:uncharacterized protein LY79DRAFT_563589 [Colletotrichum navitas]KAK1579682.1 hypothetical protein LY79DRAFT_563589 [Colletotrichum navitas]